MKSRCPNCQTVFRVTPEQLKARAGKVRCGQCQTVFNALDSLLDEKSGAPSSATVVAPVIAIDPGPALSPRAAPTVPTPSAGLREPAVPVTPTAAADTVNEGQREPTLDFEAPPEHEDEPDDGFFISTPANEELITMAAPAFEPERESEVEPEIADFPAEPGSEATDDIGHEPSPSLRLSESAAQELGKATGLIMPRETTEIPGYSKWSEGLIAAPVALPAETPTRWPFVLVALLLMLVLAGQVLFRYRSELATAVPSLRPLLASASQALGSDIPLPRHVELISIEVSDLQNDPAHGNLLVLNATLRNRAPYAQAYPSLELSLTDTQDTAVARRVFAPAEYLSPKTPAGQSFAANSDLALRLWIEARDVPAAGYRLYVFYP